MSYPSNQYILEEEYDENYEPSEDEVLEYCRVLGLDPVSENDLLYIAKEGIKAPLPREWKPVEDTAGNIYYFNFTSGESMWEHPVDEYYKRMLNLEREKKKSKGLGVAREEGKKKRKGGKGGKKMVGGGLMTGNKPPQPLGVAPAPLSSLSSLSGLPPLKRTGALAPLAPLKVPSSMGHPGSGVGGLRGGLEGGDSRLLGRNFMGAPPLVGGAGLGSSLTSTGGLTSAGSTLRSSELGGGMRGREGERGRGLGAIGTIELGSDAISTKFEEEDEEDEESSSELAGSNFKTQFGRNLLGGSDFDLKDTEEGGESSEDVSRELRRVLELGESEDSEDGEIEGVGEVKRLSTRPLNPPILKPAMTSAPLAPISDPISSSNPAGRPVTRPGAARGSRAPSLQPVEDRSAADREVRPTGASAKGVSLVGESLGRGGVGAMPAGGGFSVRDIADSSQLDEKKRELEAENKSALEKLKASHAEEMDKLREQLDRALEEARKALRVENEEKLSSLRKTLATEREAEERRMKEQKERSLESVRAEVREEEEEEEARIQEAKSDALRKLKQKLTWQREREEKELKEAKDKTLDKLKRELEEQQATEESALRSSTAAELATLRETLMEEMEEEKDGVRAAQERELAELREKAANELSEKREAMEEQHRDVIQAQTARLQEEHHKAVERVSSEFDQAHSLEEVKSEARRLHENAEKDLQTELASVLENKRKEIEGEHQKQLSSLREELQLELDKLREEKEAKMAQEKLRLREELDDAQSATTEELEGLQSAHEARKAELEQLQRSLEREKAALEGERKKVGEEQQEFKAEQERLGALRAANAQETEQLLKKQQKELRAAIEEEKKGLTSLKGSCTSLQEQLRGLEEEKGTRETAVGNLQAEEEFMRTQLVGVRKEVEKQRQLLRQVQTEAAEERRRRALGSGGGGGGTRKGGHKVLMKDAAVQTTSVPETTGKGPTPTEGHMTAESANTVEEEAIPPPSPPVQPPAHPLSTGVERVNVKSPRRKEGVKSRQTSTHSSDGGIESEESVTTVGSLQLQELATPTPKKKSTTIQTVAAVPTDTEEESSLVLEGMKNKLAENQRELYHALAEEQESLTKRREGLQRKQQALLRRKKATSRHNAQLEGGEGVGRTGERSGGHKAPRNTHSVHSSESDQRLMKDLGENLEKEDVALRSMEERMVPLGQHLVKMEREVKRLQANLEDTETSDAESDTLSEPPLPLDLDDIPSPKTYLAQLKERLEKSRKVRAKSERDHARAQTRRLRLQLSEEESSGVSSESTSELSTTESEGLFPASSKHHNHLHFSSATRKILRRGHDPAVRKRGGKEKDSEIMESLNSIGSQLGVLISKMDTPSHTPTHTFHPPPLPASLAPLPPDLSLTNPRWADPVHHPDRVDLELQSKRNAYLGGPSIVDRPNRSFHSSRPSLYSASVNLSPVHVPTAQTEQLLRSQKDWLKEFQRSVPLATRMGIPPSSLPTHPRHAPHPKPRLTLDSRSNVHLVHL